MLAIPLQTGCGAFLAAVTGTFGGEQVHLSGGQGQVARSGVVSGTLGDPGLPGT